MDSPTPAAAPVLARPVGRSTVIRLYAYGIAVVAVAIFASIRWGVEYPIVHVLAAGVCTYVGKALGLPFTSILAYAMQKQPEKALAMAVQALQSLPPERMEAAAQELISSIPPPAAQSVARVVLVNTDVGSSLPPSMPPSIP